MGDDTHPNRHLSRMAGGLNTQAPGPNPKMRKWGLGGFLYVPNDGLGCGSVGGASTDSNAPKWR